MSARQPPRVGVVIMAKRAVPGRVKTRLVGPLSAPQAAALYERMLADRCAQVATLAGVVPAIAYAADDDADDDDGDAAIAIPEGFVSIVQPPGDLGVGLAAAARYFASRDMPVVLVDSDSVTLPRAYLVEAVRRVAAGDDVVIGPTDDGGYYLIGMSRPTDALFRDIPWSTDAVVATTMQRADALGLAVHRLAPWWDVDTPGDLARLEATLLDQTWPAHTAAWLRERRWAAAPIAAATLDPGHRWSAPWRTLDSRPVYATAWLSIREDQVRLPDGGRTTYSVVDCGQCVGALPFVDDDTVLLVRQHRYVAGRVTWEMPTGGVQRGESPVQALHRELAEEAQVAAGRLDYLGAYHTSKSVMDETAHLYLARDLRPAAAQADDTEFIRIETVPFARALAMVCSGEIVDGMTIIAVLRAALAAGTPRR